MPAKVESGWDISPRSERFAKPATVNVDWLAHLETIRRITGGKTTGGNAVLEERASRRAALRRDVFA